MTKLLRCLLILLIALPLAGCGQAQDLHGQLTLSGAFALTPLASRWAEEFQHLNPGVSFQISSVGAGQGMTDLLAGQAEVAMLSRPVTPEEEAQGVFWVSVARDAVFPVVNADNPVLDDLLAHGVPITILADLFLTGQVTTWGQVAVRPEVSDPVHVYTRSDICGAAEVWSTALGGTQADLLGSGVFGDPGVVRAVAGDPLGIGYNNMGYAYRQDGQPDEGLVILPVDWNNNGLADPEELLLTRAQAMTAVSEGNYPEPPARLLLLATAGQPDGLAKAFLTWVLSDGQALVQPAGFVELTPEQVAASLAKLE